MAVHPPVSSVPSAGARLLAFLAIVVAGACGGLIGFAVADLQCGADAPPGEEQAAPDDDGCGAIAAAAAVGAALVAAGGVAVLAVLVLRAMGEWQRQAQPAFPDGHGTAGADPPPAAGPPA